MRTAALLLHSKNSKAYALLMSRPPTLPDLKDFLSRIAKFNRAQATLPPAMRGVLPMAIVAGAVIAKVTNGNNLIERHVLGKPSMEDDSIALPEPEKELPEQPATGTKDGHGVKKDPAHKKS
ncbi:hypothetical protein N7451_011639 [Penicillium sp. IBT 35674x]|nr:hypothetical protein N7451_011639 [Penicillium sp. IBT 35674x]